MDYIRGRHDAGRAPATINKELGIIRGVLQKAKRWHLFADEISRLRAPLASVPKYTTITKIVLDVLH